MCFRCVQCCERTKIRHLYSGKGCKIIVVSVSAGQVRNLCTLQGGGDRQTDNDSCVSKEQKINVKQSIGWRTLAVCLVFIALRSLL